MIKDQRFLSIQYHFTNSYISISELSTLNLLYCRIIYILISIKKVLKGRQEE